jgi:hypothetical protein
MFSRRCRRRRLYLPQLLRKRTLKDPCTPLKATRVRRFASLRISPFRLYAIETRKNAAGKVTSYRVAWQTTTKTWKRSFKNAAQADTFRGSLLTAARRVSWG